MSDKRQTFTNNFNNYENSRFDVGIAMLMTLFSKENQDILNDKIRKQLVDVQTIEDSSNSIKGLVYGKETDDIDQSRIFYIKHDSNKVAYSWHMMIHELTHFMGKPDKETIESEINSNSDKSELGGTQIFDFNTNTEYGNFFNECGADLLCEMAMTTLNECKETNPQIKSADDIIYTNERYQKTDYDSLSTIARLMVVAMDNNFSNKSYDQMIHSDSGLLDRQVQMINSQTGEIVDTVPTNDYLYAMAGHGKHLERQFDKYSQDGSYREMCTFLDTEVKALQNGNNHTVNKEQLKEQLLKMADMVNNKMYVLQNNNCINQEQKDAFVGRFNLVFNQALQEYDIGPLTHEDIKKTTQSMMQTKAEQLKKKEISTLYHSNEGDKKIDELQYESDSEELESQEQSESDISQLTWKQKIAQILQKNNFLMKVPFVEKFVDKQLNVLPVPSQERTTTVSSARESFVNWLSNNGEYRNLPPVQRMSDPERIAQMQRKMQQNQQSNEDNERG